MMDTEAHLLAAVAKVLNLSKVDSNDNFFALGGDSLAATNLISILKTERRVGLSLEALFSSIDLEEVALKCVSFDEAHWQENVGTQGRPQTGSGEVH